MNRIPLARLVKGSRSAVAYYDDYWDDYCERDTTGDPSVPAVQPDVVVEGDAETVSEFEDFLLSKERHLRGYHAYPWSPGVKLAHVFAEQFGYVYEDIFPQELRDQTAKEHHPNAVY